MAVPRHPAPRALPSCSVPESQPLSSVSLWRRKLCREPGAHLPQVSSSVPALDQGGAGGGGGERGRPQRGHGRVPQQGDRHLRELRRRDGSSGTASGPSVGGGIPAAAPLPAFYLLFRATPLQLRAGLFPASPPSPSASGSALPKEVLEAVELQRRSEDHWVGVREGVASEPRLQGVQPGSLGERRFGQRERSVRSTKAGRGRLPG